MFHVFDLCIYSLGVYYLCAVSVYVLELSVGVDTKRTVFLSRVSLVIVWSNRVAINLSFNYQPFFCIASCSITHGNIIDVD